MIGDGISTGAILFTIGLFCLLIMLVLVLGEREGG